MKKHREIVLIDTNSTYSFHEMFNASFLYMVLNNTESNILYIADPTSVKRSISLLKTDSKFSDWLQTRVQFKSQKLLKGNKSHHIFFRTFIGAILNICYLIKYRKNKIIFAQLNPISVLLVRVVCGWLKTDVRLVCHGELGYLKSKSSWIKPVFWYRKLLATVFSYGLPENMQLILLGEPIRKNLLKLFPIPDQNIIVIDHPFIFNEINNSSSYLQTSKLKFGLVGVVAESKGFKLFNKLALKFSESYPDKFEAHIVGKHSLECKQYPHIRFAALPFRYLKRKELEEAISKLDFVLYFYPHDQYQLTASGAIFEAINHRKAIVSLKNDYFSYVFEKCGQIGFLNEGYQELECVVNGLLDNSLDYSFVKDNISVAQKKFDYRNQIISI